MKNSPVFVCTKCDAQAPKWAGRCLSCGAWGTVREETPTVSTAKAAPTGPVRSPIKLSEVKGENVKRAPTGIGELDRVLGGGIVPGSVILVSGEPGVGKSTLLLQVAAALPDALYISGEESADQIAMRFSRLGLKSPTLSFLAETDLGAILATIGSAKPRMTIVDSLQTTISGEIEAAGGAVSQVRGVTAALMELAKRTGTSVLAVGQVNKDGDVAGPKMLEHLVDVVVSFEGDRSSNYRLLRTTKNRFGATDEVGVFEMTGLGLIEVKNPSAYFLHERAQGVPGSAVTCLMEGTRPILVEIQALATKTAFGYPQRRASGFDLNRLQVILALMTERLGIPTQTHDIHINVAGGYKVKEPAADAAVALAIASALRNRALPNNVAAVGEVGLGGELRPVPNLDKRIAEAKRQGFTEVVSSTTFKTLKSAIEKFL